MNEYLAIGNDNKVELLCSVEKVDSDGRIHFEVINGCWSGSFKDDEVYEKTFHRKRPAKVLWRGQVPNLYSQDYNKAIDWINKILEGLTET